MRVGRPIPAPVVPVCDICGNSAQLAQAADPMYPYLEDHGPVWICVPCQAWIGVRPRSRQHAPLGRLANAALRDAKKRLHDALEPLVAAKIRRDGVNPFEARGKAIKWLAAELGFSLSTPSIHALSFEQSEQAIQYLAKFQASRQRTKPAQRSTGHLDAKREG
ncbi:DUF3268 family zinc-finger domain-containing protein (plasmid) [Cupriavidus pinatubonensis]|uniref:zinc-finger-containing protein n=1 Tax=Cupriavidus pinatubonensis TaxID=248026 RepID=UPI001C735DA1|nr:zinc-finger-containing protein [Cupriavidus pinatubonensis]QYY33749.1 DUF3268 family zinc-finger domain-containing protein [Cupriavidus pinatubonensis]